MSLKALHYQQMTVRTIRCVIWLRYWGAFLIGTGTVQILP